MKGLLADNQMDGYVEALVREMQSEYWVEFWNKLGLVLLHFEDVGLTPTSSDLEIWQRCQAEQLILITDNRNQDSEESLESAIREHNSPTALPVFTVGKLTRLRKNKKYAQTVVERMYGYLLDIDRVRGAGRLYLP